MTIHDHSNRRGGTASLLAFALLISIGLVTLTGHTVCAAIGDVVYSIENDDDCLPHNLPDFWVYGTGLAPLGDETGDGVADILVGASTTESASFSVRDLSDASVLASECRVADCFGDSLQEYDDDELGGGVILLGDAFGTAVTRLDDLDGNGYAELAIGAPGDDDAAPDAGAVYVLFRDTTGGVILPPVKILSPESDAGDRFGASLTYMDDVDGPGPGSIRALAVGAPGDTTGGPGRGAVYLLLLSDQGTVNSIRKLTSNSPQLALEDGDSFGAALGGGVDLNADGVKDILVGAPFDDDGGPNRGAIWVIHLRPNLSPPILVADLISQTSGNAPPLADDGRFGSSCTTIDDLDGDTFIDYAVGAARDGGSGEGQGAIYLLRMLPFGMIHTSHRIDGTTPAGPVLQDGDRFGRSLAYMGDLGNNGNPALAVGAPGDDGAGTDRGAVWMLFLDAGSTAVEEAGVPPSVTMVTLDVAPNPVSTTTLMRAALAAPSAAELSLFDVQGSHVAVLHRADAGEQQWTFAWDGRDGRGRRVARGIYFARLSTATGGVAIRKIVVLD